VSTGRENAVVFPNEGVEVIQLVQFQFKVAQFKFDGRGGVAVRLLFFVWVRGCFQVVEEHLLDILVEPVVVEKALVVGFSD